MAHANPSLKVDDISFNLPDGVQLVSHASFEAHAGDIIAIVGPNGAGKTTLIRMVAGLANPSNGEIHIEGKPLGKMKPAERAKFIAYVGQSDNVDGRLTVAQYVALGLLPHNGVLPGDLSQNPEQRALSAVGLLTFSKRRMDQLSGGERQKAKIARAMCQRPKILILDEPTNHLDPQARGELLGLVAEMEITIIAALHDLTLIEAFADKVVLMVNGEVQAFGTPADVLSGERVRDVFSVDLHRLQHPFENRHLLTLDIPVSSTSRAPGSLRSTQ